jgi:outer membrane lipoprotein-sorting protein
MMIGRLILLLFFGLLASPVSAEKITVGALSEYLNSLPTLQAKFTQISADSSLSTGTIYI